MLSTIFLVANVLGSTIIGQGVCARPVSMKTESEAEDDGPWRVNLMQPFAPMSAARHKRSGSYSASSANSETPSRQHLSEVHPSEQGPADARRHVEVEMQEKHFKGSAKVHNFYQPRPHLAEWRFRAERAPQEAVNDRLESAYLSQRWPSAANVEEEPLEGAGEIEGISGDTQMLSSISKDTRDDQSFEAEDTAVVKNDAIREDSQGWSGIVNDSGDKLSAESYDLALVKVMAPALLQEADAVFPSPLLTPTQPSCGARPFPAVTARTSLYRGQESKNIDADPQLSNSIAKDTNDGQHSEPEELSLTKNEVTGDEANILSRMSKDTSAEQNALSQELPLQKSDGFVEDAQVWSSLSKDSNGEHSELEYSLTKNEGDSEGTRVWRRMSRENDDGQRSEAELLPLAKSEIVGDSSQMLSSISKDANDGQRPESEEAAVLKNEGVADDSQMLSSLSKDARDAVQEEQRDLSFNKREGISEYSQIANSFSKDTSDEQGSQSQDLTFAKVGAIGEDAPAVVQEAGGAPSAVASDISMQGDEMSGDARQALTRSSRSVKAGRQQQPQPQHLGKARKRHGFNKRNMKKKRLITRKRRLKSNNLKQKNKYNNDKKSSKQRSSH